jgi:hypothetical protein
MEITADAQSAHQWGRRLTSEKFLAVVAQDRADEVSAVLHRPRPQITRLIDAVLRSDAK